MRIWLDHLVVAGENLKDASDWATGKLGCALQQGGEHDHFGTHNNVLGLGLATYFEAIAVNPKAPKPNHPRWFGLDHFTGQPRLNNIVLATDDLSAVLAELGSDFGNVVELARGDYRWKMVVPASGKLPLDNIAPPLIEWMGDAHPAPRLGDSGLRVRDVEFSHPGIDPLAADLTEYLDDPRVRFSAGPIGLSATLFNDATDTEITL